MINPRAWIEPWLIAWRYRLRRPRRARALEAEAAADPKEHVVATCRRLSPGASVTFMSNYLEGTFGSVPMARTALLVSLPRSEFEIIVSPVDDVVVTRRLNAKRPAAP